MPLEDPEVIDIVLGPDAEGKIGLVIMDAGVTTDPRRRLELFQEKVRNYFGAVVDGHFQSQFPESRTRDFYIKAVCTTAPTPEMYEMHTLRSRSRPEHVMEVLFVQFNDQPWAGQKFKVTDRPEDIPAPSPALRKFVEQMMDLAFDTLRDDCFHPIAASDEENGKGNIGCLMVPSEQIIPSAQHLAAKASSDVRHFVCVYDAFIHGPGGKKEDALLARASERGRPRSVLFALKYSPRAGRKKPARLGPLQIIGECENDLQPDAD